MYQEAPKAQLTQGVELFFRLEMASVYRNMKSGRIEPSDGTKLTYVLIAIGKMIAENDFEKRIESLEIANQCKIEHWEANHF